MKNRGLSQEALKVIACVTMLIDHIGAALVPEPGLRIIGRIAFPIYCFLLAEGMAHTRDVKKYGLRLTGAAVLAELPFDLMLFGGFSWTHQSVMVTLLLGWGMTLWIRRTGRSKLIPVVVCAVLAELLRVDYGGCGIMIIALFVLTRERQDRVAVQTLALAAICWFMGGMGWRFGALHIPMQMCAVLAMIPIGLYSGRKASNSKLIQWGFYLFYPVHMLVLAAMR